MHKGRDGSWACIRGRDEGCACMRGRDEGWACIRGRDKSWASIVSGLRATYVILTARFCDMRYLTRVLAHCISKNRLFKGVES